jgi:hypothetical protein
MTFLSSATPSLMSPFASSTTSALHTARQAAPASTSAKATGDPRTTGSAAGRMRLVCRAVYMSTATSLAMTVPAMSMRIRCNLHKSVRACAVTLSPPPALPEPCLAALDPTSAIVIPLSFHPVAMTHVLSNLMCVQVQLTVAIIHPVPATVGVIMGPSHPIIHAASFRSGVALPMAGGGVAPLGACLLRLAPRRPC